MKQLFPTFYAMTMSINGLFWRTLAIPMGFDLPQMFRELASMLDSNVPLDRALTLIAEGRNQRVRMRMNRVKERVEAGEPLSEALDALPRKWAPDVIRSTIAAGERAGRLPELLREIVLEYERLGLIDRRLRSIFIYPLVVLLFGTICVHVIMWKVMPVFASLYSGLGYDLPFLARAVRSIWTITGPLLMIAVPLALYFTIRSVNRRLKFKGASGPFQGLAWKLPVVRGLRRALIEVRFARSLRVLVSAGVPLPDALDLCEKIVADDLAGQAIVDACHRIRNGETPSVALRGLRFLSPAFLWFLTDTEVRGDFIEVTTAMAEAAEDRFLTKVEVVERFLEPATTVALGLVIGTVVIAVYQVLFRLTTLTAGGIS